MPSDPLIVIARLAQAFDELEISYVVGGSIASSMYGIPRATEDVDFMANVSMEHVDRLVAALKADFYVDSEMIADAIRRREAFNVIHLATMFKVDIFVSSGDEWSREEMSRARAEILLSESALAVRFWSPEDTILHKLLWYRIGGNTSDKQWNDIIGVLRIQGEALDLIYLKRWATLLNLRDLLDLAGSDASETR